MELFGAGFSIVLTLVILVFTFAVVGVTFYFVFSRVIGPLMKGQQDRQRILMTGIPAQAQVMNLMQTGMLVNNNPQCQVVLGVHPQGGQPYQTTVTMILPMVAIPPVQPGAWVPVKIEPTNPMKVAIDGLGGGHG